VGPRLLHPSGRLRIADGVEEPAKKREAVPTPQSEAGSVRPERVGKHSRIVVDGAQRIGDDLRHRFGVFFVVEEVGCDARRPCDRHPVQDDPLARVNGPVMQPDVLAARLPPYRQGELMPIRGEVTEAVHRRRGAVGDDSLLRRSLPRWNLRGELQPSCPKLEVIRWWRPRQAVHALCHPVKDPRRGQSLQGGPRDAGALGLAASDEPPLILCELGEAAER
jgi:hypothetical protein